MKNIKYKATDYPSDLTDSQWESISDFFPSGNKSGIHKRSLVEAVLYLVDNGCKWRALPHDYPKWSTVKSFNYRAVEKGVWEKVMTALVKETRKRAGRDTTPSYAIIDSQSVKTSSSNDSRGFDGGKKVKGRKRHIITDTMGNILAVLVHAANIHDTKIGIYPAKKAYDKYPTIKRFCGDEGYRKTFVNDIWEWLGLGVDISKRIKPTFEVLPVRWIVERTLAWIANSRRLSKDYEIRSAIAENMIFISHSHTLLKRL